MIPLPRLPSRSWLMPLAAAVLGACVSVPSPRQTSTGSLQRAQAALVAGNPAVAASALDEVHGVPTKPAQRRQYQLLRAQVDLEQDDPQAALAALPKPPSTTTGKDAHVLKLRAAALYALNRPVLATRALVDRAALLAKPEQQDANRNLIWNSLKHMKLGEVQTSTLQATDKTTRGWIVLARLAQQHADLEQYTQWQSRFPAHPATPHLPELVMRATTAQPVPRSRSPFPLPVVGHGPIALLLPLTGQLAGAGNAIRNGFETVLSLADAPAPQVYDIGGETQTARAAVAKAVAAGASMIVGPLRKSAVTLVNLQGNLAVPVIALNYLAAGTRASNGLLQFGLSPDDQARQVATDAVQQGLRGAVALVPDGARGASLLTAFQQALVASGGQLLAVRRYTAGTTDFSVLVRQLMVKDDAPTGGNDINALARDPDFATYRRPGVDFIFISGTPTADRIMAATFRYWHADQTPIYATSEARMTSGNHDLAGLRFCTSPWSVETGNNWQMLRARLAARAGNNTQLEPLYALGADAARLALAVRVGTLEPGSHLAGYTGRLTVTTDGVIQRQLACAKNTLDGPPQLLPGAPLPFPALNSFVPSPPRQATTPAALPQPARSGRMTTPVTPAPAAVPNSTAAPHSHSVE